MRADARPPPTPLCAFWLPPCEQKPLLEFQRAKLAFEEKLQVGRGWVGCQVAKELGRALGCSTGLLPTAGRCYALMGPCQRRTQYVSAAGACLLVWPEATTLHSDKPKRTFMEPQKAGDITYSIVRPTAFFKSLAGQVGAGREGGLQGQTSTAMDGRRWAEEGWLVKAGKPSTHTKHTAAADRLAGFPPVAPTD